ncbi:uncharacterized protein [Typha latifolia]|uniref:uncharacterized protein isoform X1 n=1 Tax=Typha latifolia TaxID=4733 RepID=UPI003C2E5964
MEGLVKGLIHVALEAIDGGREDDDGPRRGQSPSHEDERSRSTWAEVVSSGHDEEGRQEQRGEFSCRPSSWNSRKEESGEGSEGDWETVGGNKKPLHPSPRRQHQLQEESEERTDERWETVGGMKQQHHPVPRKQLQSEAWHGYKKPLAEQQYYEGTYHGLDIEPTSEELDDLSKACNRLWELDINRLVPGKDYEISCGEGKKVYQKGDMASDNLFSWLSDDVLRKPTYSRFCALLDNYNPNEGCKEAVTSEEKHEQAAFVEEISRTPTIKYLHAYLVSKGILSHNYEDFKRMMTSLWFDLYGRGGGSSCSSAFEHVFVGEIKGRGEQEVSGFHNWIQFYIEEAKGTVDYQGYIFPRRRGEVPDSETQLLTIQFEWNGIMKSVSSSLIGVSPEFELALYTLCFFAGGEDNHVVLGPYYVNIKCYRLGHNKIGSVFPIAEN